LFAGLDEVAFFTNSIDTRTQGVEFVASYRQKRNGEGLNGSLAFTFNETKINNIQKTPDQLQTGANRTIALIDTISISLIETSQPRQKVVLSLGYKIKRWDASVRATYFGEVISWEKPAGANHRSQTFSGKTLVDVSVAYSLSKNLVFSVGSNNLFDVYPDKVFSNYNSFFNGQTPYTRNANQFGFNGASYYGNLTLKF
jgi:iron complex outermembrane recepter protein